MSIEEEKEFLSTYTKQAEAGQIIDLNELKAAYIEKVGHSIGGSQIYRMLERHGWRKVMPRSKHPQKASNEAIEASIKSKVESGFSDLNRNKYDRVRLILITNKTIDKKSSHNPYTQDYAQFFV